MEKKLNAPIAVFDSGLGGVSVLKELIKIMPYEDFYYYGDSKNAPYGTRPTEEVCQMTVDHVNDFIEMGAKGVAVACNTATTAAVRTLRQMYPSLPLVGIEPAVKPAVEAFPTGRILVMATPMTIREEKFALLIKRFGENAQIIPLPCPGLMDFVEAGHIDGPEIKGFLRDLLHPYIGEVDAVVLGCTHYPFVAKSILAVLGDTVQIFDGGEGTARELKRRLSVEHLTRDQRGFHGSISYQNSDSSETKEKLFWKLLKYE